jgi:hypothetical protein
MSRGPRLIVAALCCIAIGAAGMFVVTSEKQVAQRRAAMRAFDQHAREATDALADVRAAQQAYVAAGQGVAFWIPKVDQTMDTIAKALTMLQQSATGPMSKGALDEAGTTLGEFSAVDKRIRGYIQSGAELMAADIVFTEGSETAVTAAREVERARIEEHQGLDAVEASLRKQEAMALAGAGGLSLLVLVAFALLPSKTAREPDLTSTREVVGRDVRLTADADDDTVVLRQIGRPDPKPREAIGPPPAASNDAATSAIKAAAQLCTELGRVGDTEELRRLLGRAADLLDASGLMLWMATPSGAELRPALAHGYDPQTLSRIPPVPRSASNAAAAAFRTATLQVVLPRPGSAKGALVAPVLSADGCIGVLSAEIRDGAEASETVQAMAAIIAAQLAAVVASTAAPGEGRQADNSAAM